MISLQKRFTHTDKHQLVQKTCNSFSNSIRADACISSLKVKLCQMMSQNIILSPFYQSYISHYLLSLRARVFIIITIREFIVASGLALLRSWQVQIIPPCPSFTVIELRHYLELDSNNCWTNSAVVFTSVIQLHLIPNF